MTQKQIQVIDFDRLSNLREGVEIVGCARDLIRDGHDNAVPWMHNVHAQPDDRKMAFLLGRGWSATLRRRRLIAETGLPVMAINDFPKEGPKPRYWVAGDPAGYYSQRVWRDEKIMKFSPIASIDSIAPREDAYAPKLTPRDAPNSHHYHQVCNDVNTAEWLHKPWINWGATIYGQNVPSTFFPGGAARSSMLCGIRLLWHLGYREICLLGCDCTPGHHPAPMYWPAMLDYIGKLAPTFRRWGLHVMQCNPDAHLRCFDFVDFDKAIGDA